MKKLDSIITHHVYTELQPFQQMISQKCTIHVTHRSQKVHLYLDLDPMTLVLKLDLDIINMYVGT